jgi:Cd(II)/Pb(II)-responsive transcriptional regulator
MYSGSTEGLSMNVNLKIGELAKRTDLLVETIRYYEREGLLPDPPRSDGNYRLYSDTHLERLQFIRHCRSLDMTLEEIRNLLRFRDAPARNCGEVNALLDEHIQHVGKRIRELKLLQKNLRGLRNLCQQEQATKDCRILQSLGSEVKKQLQSSSDEHRNSRLRKTHR